MGARSSPITPRSLTSAMPNASNTLMAAASEEATATICISNHSPALSKKTSLPKCTFSILNIELRKSQKRSRNLENETEERKMTEEEGTVTETGTVGIGMIVIKTVEIVIVTVTAIVIEEIEVIVIATGIGIETVITKIDPGQETRTVTAIVTERKRTVLALAQPKKTRKESVLTTRRVWTEIRKKEGR